MTTARTEATAIELFHADGKPAGIYYCSECRVVHRDQGAAQACHGIRLCDCGKPVSSAYSATCEECGNREWREKQVREELARYEKAVKVSAADWKGDQVFFGDEYFENVEDAEEHADSEGIPRPEYIWAAKDQGVQRASVEDLLERVIESMWEDADADDLNGVPELEAAVAAFNAANKDIQCWMVDYSTAILIPSTERPR